MLVLDFGEWDSMKSLAQQPNNVKSVPWWVGNWLDYIVLMYNTYP